MVILLILIISLIIFIIGRNKAKIKYNLPSGPIGLPIFGNLHQLGSQLHLQFSKWAINHGPLYTVHLLHKPTLIINDIHLIKELLSITAANGRFLNGLLNNLLWSGPYGVGVAEGESWLEQKRFLLRSIQKLGLRRPETIEPLILTEIQILSNWIEKEISENGEVLFEQVLKQTTGNILWTITTGEKPGHGGIPKLVYKFMEQLQIVTNSGLVFFPWLKYFAPVISGYQKFAEFGKEIRESVESTFQDHKNSTRNGETLDLIDGYIDKVENCDDLGSSFFGEEGWKHSWGSVAILMLAGSDSTGSMLHWMIFYLSVYPEVQERLFEEIEDVIANGNDPRLEDKSKMPFMEAVILETLRYATHNPFGGPHKLLEDISFHGYHLPKGMILLVNLWHINNDPNIWKDPENFRPGRFLEENGEYLKQFVVAFHPGKRSCPGEQIGKDILFMFGVKLFQNYEFSVDADLSVQMRKKYLEPRSGIFLYPKKLGIKVKSRL